LVEELDAFAMPVHMRIFVAFSLLELLVQHASAEICFSFEGFAFLNNNSLSWIECMLWSDRNMSVESIVP
jgi:hypothetical protein